MKKKKISHKPYLSLSDTQTTKTTYWRRAVWPKTAILVSSCFSRFSNILTGPDKKHDTLLTWCLLFFPSPSLTCSFRVWWKDVEVSVTSLRSCWQVQGKNTGRVKDLEEKEEKKKGKPRRGQEECSLCCNTTTLSHHHFLHLIFLYITCLFTSCYTTMVKHIFDPYSLHSAVG